VEPINRDEIVGAIRAAGVEVFATMLGVDLRFAEAYFDAGPSRPVDGVICLIGMAGEWTGTGTISCSAEFACQIASQMLMAEYPVVDAEVLDAVAEIANMVLGNVKTVLEGSLGAMAMSIPTAIFGKNFLAKSFGDETWTVVAFECGDQRFEVKMFLRPASAATPAQSRACTPVYLRG
jgi:CheY-specific phosphatase CheX